MARHFAVLPALLAVAPGLARGQPVRTEVAVAHRGDVVIAGIVRDRAGGYPLHDVVVVLSLAGAPE